MREILFRAKDCYTNKWVYGMLRGVEKYYGIQTLQFNIHDIIPETVGQYTGLNDKNGKKIFEGDLLRNEKNICFSRSHIGKVVFEEGGFYGYCKVGVFSPEEFEYLEVVGNIHDDSPELLEVGNG